MTHDMQGRRMSGEKGEKKVSEEWTFVFVSVIYEELSYLERYFIHKTSYVIFCQY